jgi:ATP-dependent DNA helicase RecQ
LEDIADAKGMTMEKLISEMETIVFAGTRLNIDYYLEDLFDEDQLEELYEYFIDSNSDSIEEAVASFEGYYEEEELRLYRLKFMSEIAN